MTIAAQISAPFAHASNSVRRIMLLVMMALLPATLCNLYLFGWPALNLFAVTLAVALATEAGCLWLSGKPLQPSLGDGSAVLTGWLLAMSLPPWAPWWIGAVGAFIAIAVGKHVFGGLGQNLFNPAMVARVALLVSFPVLMTQWIAPQPLHAATAPGFIEGLRITFLGTPALDAFSAASALGQVKTELSRGIPAYETVAQFDPAALALGLVPGSMGETSALLLLAGGLFLMARRVITWHVPVSMLGTLFVLGSIGHLLDPARHPDGLFHLLTGATMLGAFFIATDLVTSPVTRQGQILYGAGIGLITFVIRTWAGYPEGLAFAVLLMNACTPLIDRYLRPRVFGRTRTGRPLDPASRGKS